MTQTQPLPPTDLIKAGIRELISTVSNHNTSYTRERAPLIGTVIHDVGVISLYSGTQEERFKTVVQEDRAVLVGRGGTFDLSDRVAVRQLLSTVLPGEQTTFSTMSLNERLAERGFTLRSGTPSRWKCDLRLTPLSATHPDGTTLWFAVHDADWMNCVSVMHGPHWLACHTSGWDEETLALMGMEDDELEEAGLQNEAPLSLCPSRYDVSGEALDAIILHARTRPGELLPPEAVPHQVPADFFERAKQGEFDVPEAAYTRERALADRRACKARDAQAELDQQTAQHGPANENEKPPAGDLPF